MPSDFALRVALAVTLIPALGIGGYFRRRSSTGEKLDRRQEGLPIPILVRLTGLTLWITIFWWIFDPRALDWASLPVPEWLRWLGILLFIAVFAWIIWVFRTLGHNLTDTVVTRKNATMVTSGPYRARTKSLIYGDHSYGARSYVDSVVVASDRSGCRRVLSARVADAKRRSQPARAIWGRLPGVHENHSEVFSQVGV